MLTCITNAIANGASLRTLPEKYRSREYNMAALKMRTTSADNINYVISSAETAAEEETLINMFIEHYDGRDMSYYISPLSDVFEAHHIQEISDKGHGDISLLFNDFDYKGYMKFLRPMVRNSSFLWSDQDNIHIIFDPKHKDSCFDDLCANNQIDDYNMYMMIKMAEDNYNFSKSYFELKPISCKWNHPLLRILIETSDYKLYAPQLDQIMQLAIIENHTMYDRAMSSAPKIDHNELGCGCESKSRAFHRAHNKRTSFCALNICEDAPYNSTDGCALREIFRTWTLIGAETLPQYIIRKYPQYIDHLPNVIEHLKDIAITDELLLKCPPLYWRFVTVADYSAAAQQRRTMMLFYKYTRGILYCLFGPKCKIINRINVTYSEAVIFPKQHNELFRAAKVSCGNTIHNDYRWKWVAENAPQIINIFDLIAQIDQCNKDDKLTLYTCIKCVLDIHPEYLEYIWATCAEYDDFIQWYEN
jgi:hypothetical protein